MTVRECYEAMGADYEDVLGRLRTDERIQKFVLKLLNDKSYELLIDSIESGNMGEAFRAAHTLKGVCQNLSITLLYQSSAELADRLRDGQEYGEDVGPLLEQVKKDYSLAMECIRKLA